MFLTDQVHSILLGTDGVVDLIVAANRNIPGKDELVGPLAQFWTEDRYFKNPDMIRRRLTIINRDVVGWDAARGCIDTQRGLLPDDAALVAIRRRKE
ncbi:hypothetical protein HY480_03150 [Candidatus Uhrbacteria bacterium]|nr:hypothetical protein [Candidatus Uhrbacteria bacterium]